LHFSSTIGCWYSSKISEIAFQGHCLYHRLWGHYCQFDSAGQILVRVQQPQSDAAVNCQLGFCYAPKAHSGQNQQDCADWTLSASPRSIIASEFFWWRPIFGKFHTWFVWRTDSEVLSRAEWQDCSEGSRRHCCGCLEGLSLVPLATRSSGVCGFGLNRWVVPDNARWTQIEVSQGPRRASVLLACCRKGSHRLAWVVKPRGHVRDPGSNLRPIAAICDSNDGWASPRSTSSTYVWGDSSCWADSAFI
jgi:hypothetical protein